MEEVSLTINEAKLKKITDEMLSKDEILASPHPRKTTPCAQYGVKHWKNPHAKIFYIKRQKEPGKPKEVVYSNLKIIQPDYKNLNKNDIEDMYLLIMNSKVPDYVETGLLWSLSVFIRSTVIWERVHDFQLGIESFQQKVNLTAPTISFLGIEKQKMFSIIYEPVHGIIHKNKKIEKRVMRHSEIHKFCDATVNIVLECLKSYNNDVKYGYIQRDLIEDEVEYLKLFVEEIEIIMENLPPPNNDPNIPEDEHAPVPEHAPIATNLLPIQPNNYLANDEADPEEEPEEEEEPISEQAPAAAVGFAPQWRMKRTNRSINRPPPTQTGNEDYECPCYSEYLTAYTTYLTVFWEQMQEMKKLVAGLNEQFHQIHERDLRAENEMLRISGWEYRLRDQLPLKRQYRETSYDPFTNPTSRPRRVDPYVMVRDNAVRADAAGDHGGESVDTTAVVIDAGEEKDDKGDDVDAAKDSQPLESRGSPRDPTMAPTRRSQTNPQPPLTQEAVDQLVRDGIKAAIRAERESVREEANRVGGPARGLADVLVAREYKLVDEGRKVKFFQLLHFMAEPILGGILRSLLRREVANEEPWTRSEIMMIDSFVQYKKEVQRLEDELRHLKLRDTNIAAYTERFNELALLCPDAFHSEKKKVKLYIKGLPEIIKGETTSSRPAMLNEAVRMAHALMEQKIQAKNERIAEGNKRRWENNNQGGNKNRNNNNNSNNNNDRNNNCNNHGNYRDNNRHNQYNQRRQDGERAMTAAQNNVAKQGGPGPKCNRCGLCHFGNCPVKCTKCNKMGHKVKDSRVKGGATGVNALPIRACYECGDRNHAEADALI
ncbi:putative reverse transcriptase domain-containing protein [Tanacetum coccineum]